MAASYDELDLRILRELVSGRGVSVNINSLAKDLDIHRSTARSKVEFLYKNKILNPPFYPFLHLFQEYPLLVLARADMPRTRQVKNFLTEDSNIFAAFSCMEGPYNTFLIEFFKDMETYHSWREKIVKDQKMAPRVNRVAADVKLFSNKLAFKYDPTCFIHDMRNEFARKKNLTIGDVILDQTTFRIFDALVSSKHIRTKESNIAKNLETNRKTVARRIRSLLDNRTIGQPRCFFPNFLVPPGHNLIVSMMEMKSRKEDIKNYLSRDNHVPRALIASIGRYNILIFSAFRTFEEFFAWGEGIISRFPDSIGAIDNTLLSPHMIHSINGQKVSLGFIERRLWEMARSL